MTDLGEWLRLIGCVIVGLAGLFLAAAGQRGTEYEFGMVLFIAGVCYAFYLIKQHFDRIDGHN